MKLKNIFSIIFTILIFFGLSQQSLAELSGDYKDFDQLPSLQDHQIRIIEIEPGLHILQFKNLVNTHVPVSSYEMKLLWDGSFQVTEVCLNDSYKRSLWSK